MSTASSSSVSSQQEESDQGATSACPYAQAIKNSSSVSSLPGLVELKQCPAFSNACPFSSASTAEEVSEQLQRIPIGHLKQSGAFFQTLKYFHDSTSSGGLCPVKHSVSVPSEWSFHEAMEELSLVAIMARLALAQEEQEISSLPSSLTGVTRQSSFSNTETNKNENALPPMTLLQTSPSLSNALKTGTAEAHKAAESVHFVKNFIRGKIDRDLYGLLVAQLYHLYHKLENALDEHAPVFFGSCHFPKELHRFPALKEDLEFWHNDIPKISKATKDYIERLDYLCKNQPLLLLAHAYTRYLGDLSGGKVLARVAKRALNLQDGDGLSFYQFPHVESFKLFKDKYRHSLDDLKLTDTQINDIVREANIAFLLNMRLFEELDVMGGVPGATIRSLERVYVSFPSQVPSTSLREMATDDASCPFLERSKDQRKSQSRCPWPFVVFHDPKTFLKDWQTWILFGLVLMFLYQLL